jgi:WD40 repeat protein
MMITKTLEKIQPVAVWANPNAQEALWLLTRPPFFDNYALALGKMPGFGARPEKQPDEKWLRASWKQIDGEITHGFAASPDNTRFAVGKRDSPVALVLYTVAVAEELKLTEVAAVANPHKGNISKIQFSPDGKTLATGSEDSTVCLWDVEKAGKDWKPRAKSPLGWGTVGSLAFSPDGLTLAVGTWDKGRANLYFFDVASGKAVASYRLGGQLMSVAFSPDGKTLVTGDFATGRIKLWNAGALRNPD